MAVNMSIAVHYDEAFWVWQKATKDPSQPVASIFVSVQREGRSFSE
jgi:uncharacterized membrane protein